MEFTWNFRCAWNHGPCTRVQGLQWRRGAQTSVPSEVRAGQPGPWLGLGPGGAAAAGMASAITTRTPSPSSGLLPPQPMLWRGGRVHSLRILHILHKSHFTCNMSHFNVTFSGVGCTRYRFTHEYKWRAPPTANGGSSRLGRSGSTTIT
jgi:hypothetical protein